METNNTWKVSGVERECGVERKCGNCCEFRRDCFRKWCRLTGEYVETYSVPCAEFQFKRTGKLKFHKN